MPTIAQAIQANQQRVNVASSDFNAVLAPPVATAVSSASSDFSPTGTRAVQAPLRGTFPPNLVLHTDFSGADLVESGRYFVAPRRSFLFSLPALGVLSSQVSVTPPVPASIPVPSQSVERSLLSASGTPTVATGAGTPVPVHKTMQRTEARAYLTVASSANIVVQVTRNGVAYGNPLTIPAGALLSQRDTSTVPMLAAGDILNFNITAAGTDGKNLTVKIQGQTALIQLRQGGFGSTVGLTSGGGSDLGGSQLVGRPRLIL